MNITFKDTSNIQTRLKKKPLTSIPSSIPSHFSESPSLKLNNIYQERPIKTNSTNLAFKGLFYKPVLNEAKNAQKIFNAEEFLAMTKEHLGDSAKELLESVDSSDLAKKLFKYDKKTNEVRFEKKTVLHLIYDGIVYPIKVLPGDILNGIVGFLKKIKPLQKWASKIYDKPFLKKVRQHSKIDSKVNALRGMFETVESLKGKSKEEISSTLFQRSVKMFDPKTGNYDTKHERSLNRIVSGMIPAFFLANDAYNLSSMCDNDPAAASKEKKTRFKQEISRVGLNAYITLITLGAIQKYVNNSKIGIMLNTALTVLFTESFARLSNGKQITRLTPEQARALNAKNNNQSTTHKEADKTGKTDEYKNVFFESTDKRANTSDPKFKGTSEVDKAKKKQEPLLSFSTLLKASAVIIATGYGIKGLRKVGFVDNAFKAVTEPINNLYKRMVYDKDFAIEEKTLNKIVDTLNENGFTELAKKYSDIGKGITKDGNVHLGQKDKKYKPAIDFVIAPFKFIFNTIALPYSLTDKLVKAVTTLIKGAPEKAKEDIAKLDVKALSTSIDKMMKHAIPKDGEKLDSEKFKSFINDNVLKAFNVDNMSNVSNSELANLAKTSATAATLWFLMTDNYNMVMLKSNGEDKEGAEMKFKERLVQEGSRLFYQTLLIDLFNSTFRSQYNNSLMGMSAVTATCTLIGENLTRKSIGMPTGTHSREKLIELEQEKEKATGFAKGYYEFMGKLTGKKSLAEQHKAKQEKVSK